MVIRDIQDEVLEARIASVMRRMVQTKDRDAQRVMAGEMAQLVKQRSPEQVARMEKRMGLQ